MVLDYNLKNVRLQLLSELQSVAQKIYNKELKKEVQNKKALKLFKFCIAYYPSKKKICEIIKVFKYGRKEYKSWYSWVDYTAQKKWAEDFENKSILDSRIVNFIEHLKNNENYYYKKHKNMCDTFIHIYEQNND